MAIKKTNQRAKSTPNKKTATKKSASQASTATLKLLKGSINAKRPPNNPDMPQEIIDALNTDLNTIKELLDCRKAKGFSARSLRYAQTPRINSRSFAKQNSKLSGVAG